jgi:hypothetical protein
MLDPDQITATSVKNGIHQISADGTRLGDDLIIRINTGFQRIFSPISTDTNIDEEFQDRFDSSLEKTANFRQT